MKNAKIIGLSLFIIGLVFARLIFAAEQRIITLKDGSKLRGEVVSFQNNIYTIQTADLGNIQIDAANVLGIVSPGMEQPSRPSSAQDTNLKDQVQQLQGAVLSDSEIVNDIKGVTQDPEVMGIISDPELIKTIMSYDAKKIKENSKIQQLMANPKMKNLMNKIQSKFILPSTDEKQSPTSAR